MKLDLEDIGMCLNKSLDNNIHMVEKTTQTESFPLTSSMELEGTPNGTTACNHPSMSCQELLDLSKDNNSPQPSGIVFDFSKYKYCSTYNLAEGMDSKKKQKGVYHLYSDLNVITPTKKKPVVRLVYS